MAESTVAAAQPDAQAAPAQDPQDAAKRRAAVLTQERFLLAEAANQRWVVNAEARHTPEDIMNPAYFAHVANKMTIFDEVRVRSENGDWIADLIVVACGDNWARVKVLAVHELKGEDRRVPTDAIEHYVDWKGPHHKYCVIRKADGQKLSTGHASRGSAAEWMREHERTIRRQ